MNLALNFFKFAIKNSILSISIIAAVITSIFVKPDKEYLSYFDLKTLTCLFCVLAVVCALINVNFFTIISRKLIQRFKTTTKSILALVYITFIGSMFIANDMALLTFLPLGYFVLSSTGKEKYMAFTFIMQNIAANLGGMLTPFGNPQNLYLYSYFNIPTGEFMAIMFPPFIVSILIITICCLYVKSEPLIIKEVIEQKIQIRKTTIYLILFAFSVAIIFRQIPYYLGLIIIPGALLIMDRKALKMVDYPLLFTFVCFFIFSGNMARLDAVKDFFTYALEKNTLVFSVISCQIISNVPSAILLSPFTENYKDLLIGVNIGGVGTIIASLASLITFREYQKHNPSKKWYYIKLFSIFNFSFLILLTLFALFMNIISA